MIRRLAIAGGVVVGLAGLALLGGWLWLLWYGHASQDPTFFEDEIAAFEAADRAAPPPERPIVFVGSSSIRLWDTLAEDFAPLSVLNRGFGGSQLEHVNHFLERTVLGYAPRAVLLYAGDNDLDARTGKTADDVLRISRPSWRAGWRARTGDAASSSPSARSRFSASLLTGWRSSPKPSSASWSAACARPCARSRARPRGSTSDAARGARPISDGVGGPRSP